MSNKLNNIKIEFSHELIKKDDDNSFDFINFNFDENEILKDIKYEEYDQFLDVEEYSEIFKNYLDIKKTNINEVSSNPLYFLKKIIYFYNKETFFDCYLLKLKLPPKINQKKRTVYFI